MSQSRRDRSTRQGTPSQPARRIPLFARGDAVRICLNRLKAAFAGESHANRRYLYFAQKADVEGYNDVAALFRSTAEGETGHTHEYTDKYPGMSRTARAGRRPGRQPGGGRARMRTAAIATARHLMLRHAEGRLRVQNAGLKTRDILSLVPGTTLTTMERCLGHDGTCAVKPSTARCR